MNYRILFTCITMLFIAGTVSARVWTISDLGIAIQFNDQTGSLQVTDKRCKKIWQQNAISTNMVLSKVTQSGYSLQLTFGGKMPFKADLILTKDSELEINITGNEDMPMNDLLFPGAFNSPKDHYVVMTDTEGSLLPVADTVYPMGSGVSYFCGGGLAMAWMGMTDQQNKTGYMAIMETPYDAALRTSRKQGLVTFQPVWMPSMGKLSYTRTMRYVFFDKGGYVAQCKRYRNFIWKKNNVLTLQQKQQRFPAIEKLMGAVHLYVWDNARDVSFAEELKASGIEKALILWDANHTPYPEKNYDNRLKQLGYATGGYELFTDLKLRDTAFSTHDINGPMRLARTAYPGRFQQLAARTKDQKTYFNNFGHTSCPVAIRPEMFKRIDRELQEYPHETYFLDVYQANGLFECYSPEHPLTRQQFAEEATKNYKMIEDKYQLYLGGEWGSEFTGSASVYNHGIMTLQRTWWGTGIDKKGTIYYTGDWKSNPRPTQMIGTRVANDKYLNYSINEYTRVPLYDLVYHDAVISSWRWEDGNHHAPEIWWKKDLFNILYGNAPLWNVDRNRWEEYKQTFIESYKKVCPWLQQIAYDELVSHRFVNLDRTVQETTFSSGKKAVVNFGDKAYNFGGKTIKARGFLLM